MGQKQCVPSTPPLLLKPTPAPQQNKNQKKKKQHKITKTQKKSQKTNGTLPPAPPLLNPTPISEKNKNTKKKETTQNYKNTKKINKIQGGKILIWNKGNAAFENKKDEIEIIISDHNPMCFGIVEANVPPHCHPPSLMIDGYQHEMDNLWLSGKKGRTMIYVKDEVNYIRRADLEPPSSPAIWLEIDQGTPTAWLLFIGYREWRSLLDKNKQRSESH